MLRRRAHLLSVSPLKVYRRRSLPCRNMSGSKSSDSLDDPMFPQLVRKILQPLSELPERSLHTISQLLVREKCSVPFLVRYRQKEMVDPPTEVSAPILFELQQELEKWEGLVKLRKSRLATLMKSEKPPTAVVISRLEQCLTRADLDEAYEGVKPAARTTKVDAAKAIKGLEQVAELLLNEREDGSSKMDTTGVAELLRRHGLKREDSSFSQHLQNFLADSVAHSASSVSSSRELLLHRVRVTATELMVRSDKAKSAPSSKKAGEQKECDHQKYRDYFSFDRLLRGVPPHQVLALRRGKAAGALKVSLAAEEKATAALERQLRYQYQVSKADFHPSSILQWRNKLMADVVVDAIQRLILPVVTRLAWKKALEAADQEALGLFAGNLRHLLLTPPLTQYLDHEALSSSLAVSSGSTDSIRAHTAAIVVCGVDPGFAHGHKIVVLSFHLLVASTRPELLCCAKVYPSSRDSADKMASLLAKHGVQVVAIGNGTGSREAQAMTVQALESLQASTTSSHSSLARACRVAVVSEVGASVYSVSPLADKEHPETEVSYRGAISIAGRLVDPLREMVKVPPASLGLGMYQHDLKEVALSRRLGEVLEEIVSDYGVDLNMASEEMLCYVSGLQRSRAKAIVAHREHNGGFRSRHEVRAVKGIGESTFRNCAGFLRVYPPLILEAAADRAGEIAAYDPLDATNVHPEMYQPAKELLRAAWCHIHRHKQGVGNFDVYAIRQLLFGPKLQSFVASRSEADWLKLAAASSTEVSEVKQLGLWLSAEEYCGDGFSTDPSPSTAAAIAAGCSRGIRANRGQPPVLTSVDANKEYRKKKRTSDDGEDIDMKRLKTNAGSLDSLAVGQERVGTVRNVTAFGVFVDIGAGRDGLLHSSEFAKGAKKCAKARVGVSSSLVVGTRVRVQIKNIDEARNRISLTQVVIL